MLPLNRAVREQLNRTKHIAGKVARFVLFRAGEACPANDPQRQNVKMPPAKKQAGQGSVGSRRPRYMSRNGLLGRNRPAPGGPAFADSAHSPVVVLADSGPHRAQPRKVKSCKALEIVPNEPARIRNISRKKGNAISKFSRKHGNVFFTSKS